MARDGVQEACRGQTLKALECHLKEFRYEYELKGHEDL